MKKILLFSLCVLLAFSAVGCGEGGNEKNLFRLTVTDSGEFLTEKPEQTEYAPGTVLLFRAGVLTDVDLGMFVDGELYAIQNAVETENGYVWEYALEMPSHDVTVEFRTVTGSLE